MILIDVRIPLDILRILGVVRRAVEAAALAALRVTARGQIAGEQNRGDAGDIRLERQPLQIEMQLHVLIEGFRHACGHHEIAGIELAR